MESRLRSSGQPLSPHGRLVGLHQQKEEQMSENGNGQTGGDLTAVQPLMPVIEQDVAAVKQMMAGLDQLLREVLKDGEDYGTIPGTPKPTLFKPGAEKILGMLNCAAEPEVVEKIEDYKEGFFAYTVRCNAIHRGSGQVVGSGLGACNSREKRYRKQDPFSLQNTILKMAEKRAKVSAALGVGMASEKFTQDIEDVTAKAPASPAQIVLILKLTKSHVFGEDEAAKAWTFCEKNPTKDAALSFVERLQGLIKEREQEEEKAKGEPADAAPKTIRKKGLQALEKAARGICGDVVTLHQKMRDIWEPDYNEAQGDEKPPLTDFPEELAVEVNAWLDEQEAAKEEAPA